MIKILDYYYLVLIRGFSYKLDYIATVLIAFTFGMNLFSLATLFNCHIFDERVLWICCGIFVLVIYQVLNIAYNKKRRERIREKYKDESRESRQWGVAKVVLYEIVSFAFLVWAFSMIAKHYS